MKSNGFFQKTLVTVVCSLLLTLTFGPGISGAGKLTPVGEILELAVPSDNQRLDRVEYCHDVAVAEDGTFVVTWVFGKAGVYPLNNPMETESAYPFPVYAQRFAEDGTPLTEIVKVCTVTTSEEMIWNVKPRVATDNNGNFAVCWAKHKRETLGTTQQFKARVFDAEGTPLSDELVILDIDGGFRVNPLDETDIHGETAEIAMDADGNFVVTWIEDLYGAIYMLRFNSDGAALDEIPVKVYPQDEIAYSAESSNRRPSVAMNADGGFAIAWLSTNKTWVLPWDWTGWLQFDRIMVQQFDADGSQYGSIIEVNKTTSTFFTGYNGVPAPSDAPPVIAMSRSGDFAVSYFYRYSFPGYRFYSEEGVAQSVARKMWAYVPSEYMVNAMDDNDNLIVGWLNCDSTVCLKQAIYLMQISKGGIAPGSFILVAKNPSYIATVSTTRISTPAIDASGDGHVVVIWHNGEKLLGRNYMIQ